MIKKIRSYVAIKSASHIKRRVRQRVDIFFFGSCTLKVLDGWLSTGSGFYKRDVQIKGLRQRIALGRDIYFRNKYLPQNEFGRIEGLSSHTERWFTKTIPNLFNTLLVYINLYRPYLKFINWYKTFKNNEKITLWGTYGLLVITSIGLELYWSAFFISTLGLVVFLDIQRRS